MTNLYQASNQWATRPEDERFETPEQMLEFSKMIRASAVEEPTPWSALDVSHEGNQLFLDTPNRRGELTNFAFGQIANYAGAPAGYLRELPASLAVSNLRHNLSKVYKNSTNNSLVLFHSAGDQSGRLLARATTTDVYDRVWNADVIERCVIPLSRDGWRTPPARPAMAGQKGTRLATEADIIPGQENFGLAVKVGDEIAPAGLYCSDHDMFAFMVNPDRAITAGDRQLMRGIFLRNSEVGDGCLEAVYFLLDNVCGNHICWGVENVQSVKVKHRHGKEEQGTNKTFKRFMGKFLLEIQEYTEAGAQKTEETIKRAMTLELGATKEEVLAAVTSYAKRFGLNALGKKRLEAAYDTAEDSGRFGSPRSVWGMVSGLTQNSQGAYMDSRTEIDLQATKLLAMAG